MPYTAAAEAGHQREVRSREDPAADSTAEIRTDFHTEHQAHWREDHFGEEARHSEAAGRIAAGRDDLETEEDQEAVRQTEDVREAHVEKEDHSEEHQKEVHHSGAVGRDSLATEEDQEAVHQKEVHHSEAADRTAAARDDLETEEDQEAVRRTEDVRGNHFGEEVHHSEAAALERGKCQREKE